MSKCFVQNSKDVKRLWLEIDASKFTLGRLASRVATLLRGKLKATFTPHVDGGDFVVVTNVRHVKLTGRKLLQKEYFHFSGYPGGLRRDKLRDVLAKRPEFVVYHAVRNMLPTNRLRKYILRRLKIVVDDKHAYKIDKKISK